MKLKQMLMFAETGDMRKHRPKVSATPIMEVGLSETEPPQNVIDIAITTLVDCPR